MDFKRITYFVAIFMLATFSDLYSQITDDILLIGNDIGTTSITQKQMISYAKGEKNFWTNNKKVIITLPSAKSELATPVAKSVYKTTASGMQKYWLSLVFQGRADPPLFFATDEEVIKYVQNNKGAIGFINVKSKALAESLVIAVKAE
jgi:hypothetical protein